jgi:hypothetical protein
MNLKYIIAMILMQEESYGCLRIISSSSTEQGGTRNCGLISVRVKRHNSSPKLPVLLWGPPSHKLNRYWGVNLTNHRHLLLMLKISAIIPPLPHWPL